MEKLMKHKSSIFNLNANLVSSLVYFGTFLSLFEVGKWFVWLLPLLIIFFEKKSYYVKYNAILAFIINISQIILYSLIYILFSSNKVCALGYCETIERYMTETGFIILKVISVIYYILVTFLIFKSFKYEFTNIKFLNNLYTKTEKR